MSQLSTKTNGFNGNNFQAWKLDTIAILEAKRCYIVTCKGIDPSYTEDSESSSSSSSSSEEDDKDTDMDEETKKSESKKSLKRKKRSKKSKKKKKARSPHSDSKARMIIRSNLSETIKNSLTGKTTAKEM